MIDFEIGFLVGTLSTIFIWCCYRAWLLWQKPEAKFTIDRELWQKVNGSSVDDIKMVGWLGDPTRPVKPEMPAANFAVTGKPHVPWHIRRKELEQASKTKRKKLESFQEIS